MEWTYLAIACAFVLGYMVKNVALKLAYVRGFETGIKEFEKVLKEYIEETQTQEDKDNTND